MPSSASTPVLSDRSERGRVVRNAVAMGLATGAYGLTFGALSVSSGLSLLQTCILSLVMFTGGSQFAFVGVVGGGGTPMAAAATAVLLGARNTVYGLTVSPLLRVRGWRKAAAGQLVIDESTAMSLGEQDERLARLAFYSTGLSVFVFWNAATLIGAVAAGALPDPKSLGLDAVAPAAFVFLFAPRLRGGLAWLTAAVGIVVAVGLVPLLPSGISVIAAAVAVGVLAVLTARRGFGDGSAVRADSVGSGAPATDAPATGSAASDSAGSDFAASEVGRSNCGDRASAASSSVDVEGSRPSPCELGEQGDGQ